MAAGLPVAEITLRTGAAVRAAELLAHDPRFTVGAGTVLTPADVDRAVAAAARFIVSPGFDAEVVRRCRELGAAVIPGIATPSEAMAALGEGLGIVKLFPAGRNAEFLQARPPAEVWTELKTAGLLRPDAPVPA